MGTSTSNKGPGSGVPLVPPWVPQVTLLPDPSGVPEPDLPPAPDGPVPMLPTDTSVPEPNTPTSPPPPVMAPPRRFSGARNNLGRFAQSGDQRYLKSGLGHYTRTGLGGAHRAAQRMGGTAKTAGALYSALSALRGQGAEASEIGLDPVTLQGRSAREIGDRIIEAVRPPDGTLDAEASRESIGDALRDLLARSPDVELMTLTSEQIELVTKGYIAYDLCRRIELDVGKTVLNRAPGYAEGVRRLEEIKAYVHEKVNACFRALRERGRQLTRSIAASFSARVIEDTFIVFEEFVR